MIWDILNTLFRLAVMVLAIIAITKYRHLFNRLERIGLSFMAGCAFLTIGVIWEGPESPFDGWASTIFTLGAVLFLSGMLIRKGRHDQANAAQVIAAHDHLVKRGKL